MKQNKTSQLLLALLVLGGAFLISEKAYGAEIQADMPIVSSVLQSICPPVPVLSGVRAIYSGWRFGAAESYTLLNASSNQSCSALVPFDFSTFLTVPGHYEIAFGSGSDNYYIDIYYTGSPVTTFDPTTHFISTTPQNGSLTATTTALTIGLDFYINDDEWNDGIYYTYTLGKYNTDGSLTTIMTSGNGLYLATVPTYNATSSIISATEPARYLWTATLYKNRGFLGSFIIGGKEQIMSTSSTFWVGTTRTGAYKTAFDTLDERFQNALASTTLNLAENCNPLSGFNVAECLLGVLYPGDEVIAEDFTLLKQMPPWGYAFRIYDIFTDTSSSSIPILSATIPPGVVGAGSTITLDPNHVLDQFLNATSGSFISGSATSTKTLYEITSPYWSTIVYISLGLYILRRILGQHLVGGFGDKGSISDTNSKDDSYRLKETLYKNSYRGRGGYGPFK